MKLTNRYGQNFLINDNVIKKFIDSSLITSDDSVYEIGTGHGILTKNLCEKAKSVVSSEIDSDLYNLCTNKLSQYDNLTLLNIDGLKYTGKFDIFVSSLPYSESERFIYWLINQQFKRAVVILQKEFIDKLLSIINLSSYRSISVVSQYCFNITSIEIIPPSNFHPPPKVYSTLALIQPKNTLTKSEILMIKKLFSFRRKQLGSVLNRLTNNEDIINYCNNNIDLSKRIHEFTPDIIVSLAQLIIDDSKP
ncbi:MAG: ribose ABC transporter permease [Thaumarchaeota archaeon]|jgi:16S rRNA (adenine1518-N6/adenine1519-N6)-dimethyltransferase|nr:ribose ABC transporter permease [Nitrososphaerota archaeon]NSL75245.1 ribose ABC transporter permease [Nitrososphaerota archaeon]NSL77444.1 ribose ABC transporter permease [Nitrososphaerota archaeon]HIM82846.1 ribose ABC transporter permease [Nitrososphaerales archaeon]